MIDVPYLEDENIADLALKFLDEHGIDAIPVDIEWIIESKYGIDIIPIVGMRRDTDIEGFITCDCSRIYVDNEVADRYSARYRFTLAHEIGHLYIHGPELALCNFHSIEEWKQFSDQLPRRTYSKLEYQANKFAGLVLVPPVSLSEEFDHAATLIEPLVSRAKRTQIKPGVYLPHAKTKIAEILSPRFDVSQQVVERRIEADGLMSRI